MKVSRKIRLHEIISLEDRQFNNNLSSDYIQTILYSGQLNLSFVQNYGPMDDVKLSDPMLNISSPHSSISGIQIGNKFGILVVLKC